eukprot:CAMPEP_0182913468 /NCGR_PEP_ID=MMETSP0034_2-20130328/38059_1 /TAXON_ID=156128 /ORGANISM="Nephroselmis pyriformis, Strain CCMP717" /LENGTH=57 /DNA_ID=CAMNT_0025050195 /DNA_START=9 /DNA_END=182 /DNA_ORIENTATION=+
MSFQARIGSFLAGFGAAAGVALYYVQQDITASHNLLAKQCAGFDQRLKKVEASLADK